MRLSTAQNFRGCGGCAQLAADRILGITWTNTFGSEPQRGSSSASASRQISAASFGPASRAKLLGLADVDLTVLRELLRRLQIESGLKGDV